MSRGFARVTRVVQFCAVAIAAAPLVDCGGSDETEATSGKGGSAGSGGRGGTSGTGGSSGTTAGSSGSAGSAGVGTDASSGGTTGMDAGAPDVSVDAADASMDASADSSIDTGSDSDAGNTLIDRCPGPLDPSTVSALRAGGPIGAMKWLYPYDRTVFPRGILPPVLQWSGTPPDAVLVIVKAKNFEYRGCFGPTDPTRIPIPADVWTSAAAAGSGPTEPVAVELTARTGTAVAGPITQTWTIAPGTLPGLVYYSTYGSPQATLGGGIAVMRLRPGAARPDVYSTESGIAPLGPCRSCHSVSANGKRMVLARHAYPAGPYESFSFNVTTAPNPSPLGPTLDEAGFGALLPDGSRFLSNGSPGTTTPIPFPNGPGNVTGAGGPKTSRLFDTATGQAVQTAGWNVAYAKMPSFSGDGRRLVFNNHDVGGGHSLSTMDFNPSTNAFSNHTEIFRHGTLWPGWPTFTPNGRGAVFALGDAPDYVSSHPARIMPSVSDLHYVDLMTKIAVRLSRAGGFEGGTSYLPYPGRDEHREYFPTVAPATGGGYAWLFFVSRRNYGNLLVRSEALPVETKHIWVAAIDLNAAPGDDPSHPAFFLDGQEIGSGNTRPVVAAEP
jgi:hypothetical protein